MTILFQVTSHGLPKEKLVKKWRSYDESEARKLMMWKKQEEKREKSRVRKAARARIRAKAMRKEELKREKMEKGGRKRKRNPRKVRDTKINNCKDDVPVEVLRMLLKKFTGKKVKKGKSEGNKERKEKWNGLRDERSEKPQMRKPKMCTMCKKEARKRQEGGKSNIESGKMKLEGDRASCKSVKVMENSYSSSHVNKDEETIISNKDK